MRGRLPVNHATAAYGSTYLPLPIRDVMAWVGPEEPVIEALHKMAEFQIRRMPIVDGGGRLRGILALGDIALEMESHRELADAVQRITRSTPNQSRRRLRART